MTSAEDKLAELLSSPPKTPPAGPDPTEELETSTAAVPAPEGSTSVKVGAVTSANLFQHPDAHPLVLDLCLIRKYGHEWYGWEAETVEHRIEQDFSARSVSDLCMSKIQACKALHLVDSYWQQWEVFGWVTMALSNVFPDFEVLQAPTVAQCMVSVDIANQVRDDVEWSSEIKAYLEAVHRHDGIFVPQPPLEFVHIDTEGLVVAPAEIAMLWPAVRTSDRMPTGDTVTAEQLRRMLACFHVLEEKRATLRHQLHLVSHV